VKRKTTTKERREADGKARLRRRLADLALGAYGGYQALDFDGESFAGMAPEMGMEAFGRWIGGIEHALLTEDRHKDLTAARYLEHYDTLDTATEMLWRHGVRAD
jgi:hypothetical protein